MSYRQSPFANLTPVVKNLLIINLICFIPYVVLSDYSYQKFIVYNFGLFYFNSPNFKVWQILTYMFIHGGWTHIIFNMLGLFIFGPIVEYGIGAKRFFNLYFICGIGAALFQMFIQAIEVHNVIGVFTIPPDMTVNDPAIISKLQSIYSSPVVGASGALFGISVAFAMLYPDMEMMMLYIPFPVKAKYFIPIYLLGEIYAGLSPAAGDNIAHFAHIGGALIAFVLLKIWRYR